MTLNDNVVYAECYIFIAMLSVILLIVITVITDMLRVIMLNVIMMSVAELNFSAYSTLSNCFYWKKFLIMQYHKALNISNFI